MSIPRRRDGTGCRSDRPALRLGCMQRLERGEYRIRREFRIRRARLRRLDLYRNGVRNKALAREGYRDASAESSIEHGVRQRQPSDAVASAPCGLEFK